jgi:hypothetical protein
VTTPESVHDLPFPFVPNIIATVRRAWYLLDERVAFNLPARRSSLRGGQQLELIRCDTSRRITCGVIVGTCKTTPGIRAQFLGLNPTYLPFFGKGFRHVEMYDMLVN